MCGAWLHHLRTAHAIICGIAIRLEKSFEVTEEVQWALAFAAHAEIKNRHAPRRPVLPEVSLMVSAASVVRLYIDRSFIRLGIAAAVTPCSGQDLQARFSRLVTCTKYRAGSTSSTSLTS